MRGLDVEKKKLKCLIVEDERLAITMMERYINSRSELELIGTAKDQDQFIQLLTIYEPDIIFLDIGIPPGDFSTFHELKFPKATQVVIVSAYNSVVYRNIIGHHLLSELPKPITKSSFNRLIDHIVS